MTLPLFNLRLWQQRRTQSRARPTPGSEIIEEKLGDTLHQDAARCWIADAVAAARKWPARKPRLKIIARFNHLVKVHVAAVTPSPNPDAIRIDVRKRLEIAHAIALVGKLLRAHAEMQRRFKSMAAPRRAAIVE